MHGLLDTNVFIYEVSAQKPSQLVLDGATELILLKYNCDDTLVVESENGTFWSGNLILLHYC